MTWRAVCVRPYEVVDMLLGRGADVDIGRGLHSFLFQLNLSSSVHRTTQINS